MMEKRFRWSKKAGSAALAAGILASVLLFAGCGKNAEQTAESITQTETSGREDSQVQQESNEAESSQRKAVHRKAFLMIWKPRKLKWRPQAPMTVLSWMRQ